MDIDSLSQLSVDVFIKNITYLPFDNVITICTSNKKLDSYCNDPKYNNRWKKLIDDTFGGIYDYQNKLKEIRSKLNLNEGTYNYLVYTQLVKLLDTITQLMIYYRQGDMKSFEEMEYLSDQRFLALFLLGEKNKIKNYLPPDKYSTSNRFMPFISMLNGIKMSEKDLINMLEIMISYGNVQGVDYLMKQGANIHVDNDVLLIDASFEGYLEVVKYLIEHGADIHTHNDMALKTARDEHPDVVKYLLKHGAIDTDVEITDRWAHGVPHPPRK